MYIKNIEDQKQMILRKKFAKELDLFAPFLSFWRALLSSAFFSSFKLLVSFVLFLDKCLLAPLDFPCGVNGLSFSTFLSTYVFISMMFCFLKT
jgi:hypothetical protein